MLKADYLSIISLVVVLTGAHLGFLLEIASQKLKRVSLSSGKA